MQENNIISLEDFRKKKEKEETGSHYPDELLTDEEAVRLVDALFLGQGQCSESEGQAIIRWANKTRINEIILNSVLNGYINCSLDTKGNVKVVLIEEDEEL